MRAFLASNPRGEAHADGLFKLAELLWEDARRGFVARMDRYERALEACRQGRATCKGKPAEPRIDLREPAALYRQLLTEHPEFRHNDLVTYLVGFAAKETGNNEEALGHFRAVIDNYPTSRLSGDAWMMIGEHYFAAERWEQARGAYAHILTNPGAPTFDLALFKTAWCDWKLGQPELAARRFKRVLDLAASAERSGNDRTRRRRAQLRDEALEYLVVVFTEDRRISAKEVYEFLASIGGEQYSRDVLVRVADAYVGQSEFERAVATYQFLIALEPSSLDAAKYQRAVVDSHLTALATDEAIAAIDELVTRYGAGSDWAEANANAEDQLARSLAVTERLVRSTAKNFHAEAQASEKHQKRPDRATYARAATLYELYLTRFGTSKWAPELRFLRAEILYYKLDRFETAGDEYLAVGRARPIGRFHKDALLKAMDAFEKARPADRVASGRRELHPVDRKLAAAIDRYATLFPADPELVGVIFRNGQLFYDYGDYDEAIKRFGLIVTKYPDDPNAGPAGDRILAALAKAEDYDNIEEWARKLKGASAFAEPAQQARLDRLIVEAISKSGQAHATAGDPAGAAALYLRIPKEFPEHALAAPSLMNAGVMLEKAKQPEKAASVYLALAERYPQANGSKAAFAAGKVYESVAYFERAAEAYEVVASRFSTSAEAADAVYNAGLLRQALGQHEAAIAHYTTYAKRHRERDDAALVAFNIGVVYEEAGDWQRAGRAYLDFIDRHRRSERLLEAQVRAARVFLAADQTRRAARRLDDARQLHDHAKGGARAAGRRWAAEAAYLQGELLYRQYAAIALDVAPRRLRRTLDDKTALLGRAQTAYLAVVELGDPQWATAALHRMGQIYDAFSEAIRNAPVPPKLAAEDAELYRQELEMYVIDIEEKAIELYATGYQKAIALQVYNQHTSDMRAALGRLAAARFPPVEEAFGGKRMGDRPIEVRLVEEVIRGE